MRDNLPTRSVRFSELNLAPLSAPDPGGPAMTGPVTTIGAGVIDLRAEAFDRGVPFWLHEVLEHGFNSGLGAHGLLAMGHLMRHGPQVAPKLLRALEERSEDPTLHMWGAEDGPCAAA